MTGVPIFHSPVAYRVFQLSEKLRGLAHWIERRYRKRKGLQPSPARGDAPNEGLR